MAYKTPGVYIKEVPLFPPSVAQVETAIPAFVGYTEKAIDPNGKLLTDLPVKIKSLVEFQSLYGSGYTPSSYKVVADNTKGNSLVSVSPNKQFYLYDALRQFYDNGGGDCYIVSVGPFADTIDFARLKTGYDLLRKFDEPTLLLAPDAVGLKAVDTTPDLSKFSELQKLALKQCADLQDRFCIFDVLKGYLPEDVSNKPISDFRDNIGINFLNYGAAYYPWIIASYNYDISFRQLHVFDKADLITEIVNFTTYSKDDSEKGLMTALAARQAETNAAIDISDPVVDKVILRSRGTEYIKELLASYATNIAANTAIKTNITNYLNLIASTVGCFKKADTIALAGSGFQKDIDNIKATDGLTAAIEFLIKIEINPTTIANTLATRDAAAIQALYIPLETDWLGGITYASITADSTVFPASNIGCLSIIAALNSSLDKILSGYQSLLDAALFYESQAEQAVFASHSFFHGVRDKVMEHLRTLPPSGSVAGIYATIDRTRGVWKAPANVSINSIIGPAVKIDSHDQEDLNVHTTGKSVNAIRAFTGKGTLVWGSRTLAGNDNEWRYVPVRRFFIMVEESTKKATEPFVFEPNDANTWMKVRSMIENFLILQWRAGALQGAKPDEAFFVHVGLGETMSELDILEGRMIVEIGMAVVRPAEFIILRFSHKMLSSKS
jgi:uncharacterized protein